MRRFLIIAAMLVGSAHSEPGTSLSGNGRYAIGQISSFRSDQYMIDSQTGRLWKINCASLSNNVCQKEVLVPVVYMDQKTGLEIHSPDELMQPLPPGPPVKPTVKQF